VRPDCDVAAYIHQFQLVDFCFALNIVLVNSSSATHFTKALLTSASTLVEAQAEVNYFFQNGQSD
jgi:hypothetical protein